eukprot:1659696-Pyramimonas_sp.AAC.1
MAGVSSFAFQGTNAHVLLSVGTPVLTDRGADSGGRAWQHSRHWPHPQMHPFLNHASMIATSEHQLVGHFQCRLQSAVEVAHVLDHRVGGRALFPGA